VNFVHSRTTSQVAQRKKQSPGAQLLKRRKKSQGVPTTSGKDITGVIRSLAETGMKTHSHRYEPGKLCDQKRRRVIQPRSKPEGVSRAGAYKGKSLNKSKQHERRGGSRWYLVSSGSRRRPVSEEGPFKTNRMETGGTSTEITGVGGQRGSTDPYKTGRQVVSQGGGNARRRESFRISERNGNPSSKNLSPTPTKT